MPDSALGAVDTAVSKLGKNPHLHELRLHPALFFPWSSICDLEVLSCRAGAKIFRLTFNEYLLAMEATGESAPHPTHLYIPRHERRVWLIVDTCKHIHYIVFP